MRGAGFQVEARDISDEQLTALNAQSGVPGQLEACHTAQVGGYLVEGHVPAEDVRRLLRERPQVIGIAVPGMPQGSPGMSGRPEPYQVIAFAAGGRTSVWARH